MNWNEKNGHTCATLNDKFSLEIGICKNWVIVGNNRTPSMHMTNDEAHALMLYLEDAFKRGFIDLPNTGG